MSFTSFIKPETDPNIIVPTKPFNLSPNIVERFSLKDKVAVITGGAGAIGSAIAEGYAQAGAHVILLDFATSDNGLSERLSATYGIKSKFFKIDVTDAALVEHVINIIDEEFGTIDVFVANAGIAWYTGSILNQDSTPESWRRVFDVNVNGVFYCAKYAGQIFKRNGKGSFIITASMSAHINNVPNYQTCYNSAKAAVMHMAKGLAVEFAGFARVNSVSPGYTNTLLSEPIPKPQRAKWWGLTPMGREAETDELVGAYLYLASDASSFTTGSDIRVDGGYCCV
ncbi:putative NADP-dependent mannitol dehydrogenase [Candida viswanathii]|uniref:Putative NADP-dependent mannitol dehydrogenase n=1 Tax=Candida viswanathii TaxID=5486 RepID=A0A367Y577_9ASCO|nr:putative NADP-dependent mannitol dehydrogenase [Candida viswanathii]